MIQCRCRLCFAAKAFQCLGFLGKVFRQEFEGNKTVKAFVLRFVNHTHPAAIQLVDDTVVRNGTPEERVRSCSSSASHYGDIFVPACSTIMYAAHQSNQFSSV